MTCSPGGSNLIQTTTPWNLFILRKLNLGPDTPLHYMNTFDNCNFKKTV